MNAGFLPTKNFPYLNPITFQHYSGLKGKDAGSFIDSFREVNNHVIPGIVGSEESRMVIYTAPTGNFYAMVETDGKIDMFKSILYYLNVLSRNRGYIIRYFKELSPYAFEATEDTLNLIAHFEESLMYLLKIPTIRHSGEQTEVVRLLFDAYVKIIHHFKLEPNAYWRWTKHLSSKWFNDLYTQMTNVPYDVLSTDEQVEDISLHEAAHKIVSCIKADTGSKFKDTPYTPFDTEACLNVTARVAVSLNINPWSSLYVAALTAENHFIHLDLIETSPYNSRFYLLALKTLVCLKLSSTIPPEYGRIGDFLAETKSYLDVVATAAYLRDRRFALLFKHTGDDKFKEWEHICKHTWDTYIEVYKGIISFLGLKEYDDRLLDPLFHSTRIIPHLIESLFLKTESPSDDSDVEIDFQILDNKGSFVKMDPVYKKVLLQESGSALKTPLLLDKSRVVKIEKDKKTGKVKISSI